jgi:hypothetical protein
MQPNVHPRLTVNAVIRQIVGVLSDDQGNINGVRALGKELDVAMSHSVFVGDETVEEFAVKPNHLLRMSLVEVRKDPSEKTFFQPGDIHGELTGDIPDPTITQQELVM